jgi:hypothetical protein
MYGIGLSLLMVALYVPMVGMMMGMMSRAPKWAAIAFGKGD